MPRLRSLHTCSSGAGVSWWGTEHRGLYLCGPSGAVCLSSLTGGEPKVRVALQPQGLQSPRNSPGQNTGVGSLFPSLGDLPNPGIEPATGC